MSLFETLKEQAIESCYSEAKAELNKQLKLNPYSKKFFCDIRYHQELGDEMIRRFALDGIEAKWQTYHTENIRYLVIMAPQMSCL